MPYVRETTGSRAMPAARTNGNGGGGKMVRRSTASIAPQPIYTREGVVTPGTPRMMTYNGRPIVAVRRSNASLQGYSDDELGSIFGNIVNAVKKGVTDVGHTVGSVVTSKIGQGLIGGALALTGVGLPAAAAIMAGSKGIGTLIKPGGNLKGAATGAAQGAVEGVVAAEAGSLGRSLISHLTSSGAASGAAAQSAAVQSLPASATGAAAGAGALLNPNMPGVSITPSSIVSGLAAPTVMQPAPPYPLVKRVAGGSTIYGTAGAILDAGTSAKQAATQASGKVRNLQKELATVNKALAAAQALGDQTGITQLSSAAQALQGQVTQAIGVAGGVASDINAAGGAIQGGAQGLVSGAAGSGLGDFVVAHKTAFMAGGAAVVALAVLRRGGPSGARSWQ